MKFLREIESVDDCSLIQDTNDKNISSLEIAEDYFLFFFKLFNSTYEAR